MIISAKTNLLFAIATILVTGSAFGDVTRTKHSTEDCARDYELTAQITVSSSDTNPPHLLNGTCYPWYDWQVDANGHPIPYNIPRVSGTNVKVTFAASARQKVAECDLIGAICYKYEFYIDDVLIHTKTLDPIVPPTPPGGGEETFYDMDGNMAPEPLAPDDTASEFQEYSQQFDFPYAVFSSLKFTDYTFPVLKVKLWFKLYHRDGSVTDAPAPVIADLMVCVYNKYVTWRTAHPPYMFDQNGNPIPPPNGETITQAVLDAGVAKYNSAKYSRLNTSDYLPVAESTTYPRVAGRQYILDCLRFSSAVFVITHGALTGLADSYTAIPTLLGQYNGWTAWSDIAEATRYNLKADISYPDSRPKHSLVILYACSTFGSGDKARDSFNVANPAGCALGFYNDVNVLTTYKDGNWPKTPTGTLNQHATKLFGYLDDGYCADDAMRKANDDVMPANANWTGNNRMLLSGDPLATYKYVYLTAQERTTLSDYSPGNSKGTCKKWIKVIDGGVLSFPDSSL